MPSRPPPHQTAVARAHHRARLAALFSGASAARVDDLLRGVEAAVQSTVLRNGKRKQLTDAAVGAVVATPERYAAAHSDPAALTARVNCASAPLSVADMLAERAAVQAAQRKRAAADALAASVVTAAHHEAARNGALVPNELQGKGRMAPQDANGGALMDLSAVLG